MKRQLWTLFADQTPVAVIAAPQQDQAWKIVQALDEHRDLPQSRNHMDLHPATRSQCQETEQQADALGISDSFLACIRGGMFLTFIEGLVLDTSWTCIAERTA